MKKGFTLIELLAVIVVLAILALIVTPVVINIITKSQEGADRRSIEQYAKIVKENYLERKISDSSLTLDNYLSNKLLISSISYEGNKIECTGYKEVNNEIELYSCVVNDRGYYDYIGGKTIKLSEDEIILKNESIDTQNSVYFDVAKGYECTKEEYDNSWDGKDFSNSYAGYNGINNITCSNRFNPSLKDCTTSNELKMQNSCLKFYSFSDDGENLYMILDHNIISVPSIYYRSGYGGKPQSSNFSLSYILDLLNNYSSSWNGANKIRLLEFNEVAQITGNVNWNETETASQYNFNSYGWLYDRIDYGYWISSSNRWYVSDGYMNTDYFYYSKLTGGGVITGDEEYTSYRAPITVRPVIEVPKSSISQ